MSLWIETSLRYDKMQENGTVKKVTEKFLCDALTCVEAEQRTIEEASRFISGEYSVTANKKTPIAEVIGDENPERYFLAKIGLIVIDEKSGKEKRNVMQMLVGAENFIRAIDEIHEAMRNSMSDYDIVSLAESPIVEVFKYEPKAE